MDKRIRKTRKNIFDVFIQLLEEKRINEITTQEIVELADISRSTFYLHYSDIYDLLDQAEDEIFNEIEDLLEGYTYEVIKMDPLRLFTDLFQYFYNNAKICVVLLNKNGSITTGQRISKMIQDKLQNEWEALIDHGDVQYAHFLSEYIIAGFVGILRSWMADGMKQSAEDMATLARSLINNSIDFHNQKRKEGLEMSELKNQIREDAKGLVSNLLNNTSGLLNEKSGEIQHKVESGLSAASSRLAQKGNSIAGERPDKREHELQKLDRKKNELIEKYNEKVNKLKAKGKEQEIDKERIKYEGNLKKLEEEIAALSQ